ncbi:histidine kinase [Sphingomonas naphthae]|uniref:Histidine kinase n=1 Tax=Sphingomonas naphthae TaxID=1813468 RepID=A0ABY7TRS3_9SPHN|nr:histidine kinase [Sphingomonas naphthae]WCT75100.1 histidine kinase [Sphingomonas naphthae]
MGFPIDRPLLPPASPSTALARWSDALRITVGLWLLVLLIYLPLIVARYPPSAWASVVLDSLTVTVSMALAMPLFALFRMTAARNAALRIALLVPAILSTALSQALFDAAYTGWLADRAVWVAAPASLAHSYGAAFNYACVFAVNVALFQLALMRRRSWADQRRIEAIRAGAQAAQIEAMRRQIDPHFLFNSLNALSALIVGQRNGEAEELTDRLSRYLRTTSALDLAGLVSVEDELDAIGDYLAIEQIRFGGRLTVTIDCDPRAAPRRVPAFLLQPIVADAIEATVSPFGAATVGIEAAMREAILVLTLRHGAAHPLHAATMADTRERLGAMFGDRARVMAEDDGIVRILIAEDAR